MFLEFYENDDKSFAEQWLDYYNECEDYMDVMNAVLDLALRSYVDPSDDFTYIRYELDDDSVVFFYAGVYKIED